MRSDVVVVVSPESPLLTSIGKAVEDILIQALVPQAAVEAFDQPALRRFAVNPGHRGQFPRTARTREAGMGDQSQSLARATSPGQVQSQQPDGTRDELPADAVGQEEVAQTRWSQQLAFNHPKG